MKVACVQNCASNDMAETLNTVAKLIYEAAKENADLIALPEYFSCLHVEDARFIAGALPEDQHPALLLIKDIAKEVDAWILIGSLAIDDGGARYKNRSFMIDSSGEIKAKYDKIHMFDVTLDNGQTYRESEIFKPGDKAVMVSTPWGKIGLSICYDLRFAYLYRSLAQAGASILTVPAAFMHATGRAHWHALLRARAIETGSYVIAPCQYGKHGKARTYGHSLIVDPWGEIQAEGNANNHDIVTAILDLDRVGEVRDKIPALRHDRSYDNLDI